MTYTARATPVIDGPEALQRILDMEAAGQTRKSIARDLGVDYTRLCRELNAAGHPGRSGVRSVITEEQIAEGTRLVLEERLTYVQAAARLDVSLGILQNHLFKRGVRVGRRVKMTDADVAEAAILRRDHGWTHADLADRYGVSVPTIAARLALAGTQRAA